MQAQPTEPATSGVCVAHGYGLKITVHRGHLVVQDGIGRQRHTRRYHRVTSKLRRLLLIGHTGYITLDALRWLHDIGAALVHLDADGQLMTASTAPSPGLPKLRRSQALATGNRVGVQVARYLLDAKIHGQAALLDELPAGADARDTMQRCLQTVSGAQDLRSLLGAEAEAAAAYWEAWSSLPTPLGDRDLDEVPAHWRTFGRRHSLLTSGPRAATNPPNAILNYLYALLEAETTLACHAVGLDPLLGIFHTDQRNRASLALDLMEAARPTVDAFLLALLTQRTLNRNDFIENRQGQCRIVPRLAAELAQTVKTWRHHIGPTVEGVAHALGEAADDPSSTRAPVTRAHHQAAWADRGSQRAPRPRATPIPALPNSCRDCGAHLPDRRRRYCDACRTERWQRHATQGRDNAAAVLKRLRAEQQDPAHGGHAGKIRGEKNSAHQKALRQWNGPVPDPDVFRAEILPRLQDRHISDLAGRTGLSEHYCSLIRLGKRVPHPRHWANLMAT